MRILLVAPQSRDTILGTIGTYCQQALRNLGLEPEVFDFRKGQHLQSQAGTFFKKALKKAGLYPPRRIPFMDSLEKEKMNQRLSEVIKDSKPDVMLVLMGETISPETLRKAKKQGVVVANWFHDTVLAPQRRDFVQEISPFYDYFFIVDSESVQKEIRISSRLVKTIPLACAPQVHKVMDLAEEDKRKYRSQISFVGTMKFDREEVLSQLTDFDLGIWGYWRKKNPQLARCYREMHSFGEEATKIYNASDIVLDINQGNENQHFYVTPRVFEVPACRAFLLTEENPSLSKLYEIGQEIVCYRDEKELRTLIKYYLAYPEERMRIARRGQERAYGDHTYEKRLSQILSFIEKNG